MLLHALNVLGTCLYSSLGRADMSKGTLLHSLSYFSLSQVGGLRSRVGVDRLSGIGRSSRRFRKVTLEFLEMTCNHLGSHGTSSLTPFFTVELLGDSASNASSHSLGMLLHTLDVLSALFYSSLVKAD